MNFVNRVKELASLEKWWSRPGPSMGMLYGRRRVGKTALVREFAKDKRAIIHLGTGVPRAEELARLTRVMPSDVDLHGRTLVGWEEAIRSIADAAKQIPLLLVLDEFPELRASDPHIEGKMRAVWEEVITMESKLKILLTGSAVRTMWSIGEARYPLHGRFDFRLLIHPFRTGEVAPMLQGLKPAERAIVWGICDGTPLYLSWWDQNADLASNIEELFCTSAAKMRNEAELVLATEGVADGLAKQVLSAIALGKNRHSEIVGIVPSERQVANVLDDLEKLRLVERVIPITDDVRAKHGRTTYRIADNFLAFWLSVVERSKREIELGNSAAAAQAICKRIDDYMGKRYEAAFLDYMWRQLAERAYGEDALRVGPFWTRGGAQVELDAVVLTDDEIAIAIGECKWDKRVNGAAMRIKLLEMARALPKVAAEPEIVVCARDEVTEAARVRAVTATDIFG